MFFGGKNDFQDPLPTCIYHIDENIKHLTPFDMKFSHLHSEKLVKYHKKQYSLAKFTEFYCQIELALVAIYILVFFICISKRLSNHIDIGPHKYYQYSCRKLDLYTNTFLFQAFIKCNIKKSRKFFSKYFLGVKMIFRTHSRPVSIRQMKILNI